MAGDDVSTGKEELPELLQTRLRQLLAALQHHPALFPHPITQWTLVETHISWLLLTGPFVYKFKKPVNFGFIDFSSLAKRQYFCQEELRLNRRLAPHWYQAVVAITGSLEQPQLDGEGEVLEYAVKMTQFPAQNRLDNALQQGWVLPRHIEQLAKDIAQFHQQVAIDRGHYGEPEALAIWVMQNFSQLQPCLLTAQQDLYQQLLHWTQTQHTQLSPLFWQRQQQGFIREGHGDLHLANLVLSDDHIVAFDALEFNPALRWIDVMSEIAFVCMDLQDHQHWEHSNRLLNHYLQQTGDYAGLAVLSYYQVYRALVRAKVACLQHQPDTLQHYLRLAATLTASRPIGLMITHGLSGSGKSYFSQQLCPRLGFIHLCADIERKRLYPDPNPETRYAPAAHDHTYQHLHTLAQTILQAGYGVIVDATFLNPAHRQLFFKLAQQQQVPFHILHFQAETIQLQARINQRQQQGNDASEATVAVLASQSAHYQPLTPEEQPYTHRLTANHPHSLDNIIRQFSAVKLQ